MPIIMFARIKKGNMPNEVCHISMQRPYTKCGIRVGHVDELENVEWEYGLFRNTVLCSRCQPGGSKHEQSG